MRSSVFDGPWLYALNLGHFRKRDVQSMQGSHRGSRGGRYMTAGRLLATVIWWAMKLEMLIRIVTPKEIAAGRKNFVGIDSKSRGPTPTCNLSHY